MAGTQGVHRLVSGIRPSGSLHLGHYVGLLRQWLALQDTHECFFLVADVQSLATQRDDPSLLAAHVRDIVLDALAVGIDPERSSFVLQSRVPELAELTVYLQMLVRTGDLRANPTAREEARLWGKGNLSDDLADVEVGFLAYPVSQAADVLAFSTSPPGPGDSLLVPVGFDQVPHVAFAADLANRFNARYGPTFLLPEARTTDMARLPGIDGGSKMGKSRRNAILLKDGPADVEKKVLSMLTDPLRVRREDPGHPDDCPCFAFRQVFGGVGTDLAARREHCLGARTDCEECKVALVGEIQEFLGPIQTRREECGRSPDRVAGVLDSGIRRARAAVRSTLERARDALGLSYPDLAKGR